MTVQQISRRGFLQVSLTASGALLIGLPLSSCGEAAKPGEGGLVGLYVRIEPDDRIVIGAPSTEMGQGINTAMPMMIAEELDVDWDKVTVEQLPLMIKKAEDGKGMTWVYFPQGAGGSSSVIDAWALLRVSGARARALLVNAAAARWKVPAAECTTQSGAVLHAASGKRLTYSHLAVDAAKLPEPTEPPPLKERAAYRILGQPIANAQAKAIVMGREEFGLDAELPGMLYAVIARAPQFDSRIDAIDDTAARAVAGVKHIVRLDGPLMNEPFQPIIASGVAVVATSLWAAMKGRDALKVTWTPSQWAHESSESLREQAARLMKGQGEYANNVGDFDKAIAGAAKVIERTYEMPYVSHATMEPQNCIAHVQDARVDIIAPTQSPGLSSRLAHAITGIDRSNISVRMTRLGGGFGRRLEADYVAEAVMVSKEIKAPVKVVWTREDDLRHDFYRPACRHHLVMGLDAAGKVIAWNHRVASTSKWYREPGMGPEEKLSTPDLYDVDFPGNFVPNFRREYFALSSGAPRRSWRAPGHTANAFAVQSFLDEAAHELGQDPLAFQLAILGNEDKDIDWWSDGSKFNAARWAGVLKLAAEKSGWGTPLPQGRGRGIAGHFTFSSYCAHVVEVSTDGGRLVIEKVTSAIDCGFAVNPLGVRAQVEGGINDALSTALGQAVTIKDGAVVEGNFDTYRMMRLDQSPRAIDVHIVESPRDPTGVGEPPVPPLAPALTNAIFAATGKRIRNLPIADQLSV